MADRPTFEYRCDRNHEIVSRTPITKCSAVVKGKPCPGKLTRFGPGSRTPSRKEGTHAPS